MTQAWLDQPVFLTGLMKSGTTLLLGLMDGADGVLCYPDEPSFDRLWSRRYDDAEHMLRDWIYGTPNPIHLYKAMQEAHGEAFDPRGAAWAKEQYPLLSEIEQHCARSVLRGLDQADGESLFDRLQYLQALAEPPQEGLTRTALVRRTLQAFHRALRRPIGQPRAWAFKQPMPIVDPVFLDWFWAQFPAGKVVFIVRDPRAYYVSRIDYTRRSGLLQRVAALRRRLLILSAVEADYRQIAALHRRADPRACFVRYEDLVSDAAGVMQRVADFVGVPYTEAMSRPTKLGVAAEMPTATRAGGNTVFQSSKDRWRERLGPVETAMLEAATQPALDDFGYDKVSSPWVRALMAGLRSPLATLNRMRRKPVRLKIDLSRSQECLR
ncbi:MAG TPA: sulfotransferase [Solimonas sp.]|nr:sulfotransferase [Solimonas sp.]